MSGKKPHRRPSRRAGIGGGAVLAATLAAEPFVHLHPQFGLDGLFGFHAWFGFGAALTLVLFASFVGGALLSRDDDYYDA